MATQNTLRRGFKAKAERLAEEYRKNLNIHPCAPLPALSLAEYLNVIVYKATDFLTSTSDIDLLSGKGAEDSQWSALTMVTKQGNRIIIHNPYHSKARQESDLMHELAHIICEHKTIKIEHINELPLGMRQFDSEQEEEAKWLGATLQLATPCLLWAKKRDMTDQEIAEYYTASLDMVKYRINTTGIAKRRTTKVRLS